MNYRMRGVARAILVSLGLVACSSCFPRFENPLPVPKQLKADNTILGSWVIQPKKSAQQSEYDREYLHIYARQSGWVDVVYVAPEGVGKDREYATLMFEGYTVPIKDATVLCVRQKQMIVRGHDAEEARRRMDEYEVFPYQVAKDGCLRIWFLSEEKVAQMVEKHELKGDVTRGTTRYGGPTVKVRVTASSTDLESALTDKGVEALINTKPEMIFTRQEIQKTPNTAPEATR